MSDFTPQQQKDIRRIVTRMNDVGVSLTPEEQRIRDNPALSMSISTEVIGQSNYARCVADIIKKSSESEIQFHPQSMDAFFPNYGHEGKTLYVSQDGKTALEFHDRNQNGSPDSVKVYHASDGHNFSEVEVSARFLEDALPNSGLPKTMAEIPKGSGHAR